MKSRRSFKLSIISLVVSVYSTTTLIRASETEPLQPSDARASIEGKITVEDSGTPVAGALINIFERQQGWRYSALTDEAGRYKLTELFAGEYKLYVWPPTRFRSDTNIYCDLAQGISGTVCSEFFNNKLIANDADHITLYSREIIRNFDISLSQGIVISGVVLAEDTLQPLAGVPVTPIYSDDTNVTFYTTYTDANGAYALNLPHGNYKLHFGFHDGYIGEYFPKRPKLKDGDVINATQSVTNVNSMMTKGGLIAGKVNVPNVSGSEWMRVQLIPQDNPGNWDYPRDFFAFQLGGYTFTVPTGNYKIRFFGVFGYAGEYYNDQSKMVNATVISITAPNAIVHIDANLEVGGVVTGQLVSPPGEYPNSSAEILLMDADTGEGAGGALTWAGGYYEIRGIQTGRYKLRFSTHLDGYGNGFCISTRYYPNAGTFEGGEAIAVVQPNVTSNINATIYPCEVYLRTWLPLIRR